MGDHVWNFWDGVIQRALYVEPLTVGNLPALLGLRIEPTVSVGALR